MSLWRVRRFRHWWSRSLWIVPGIYATAAITLAIVLVDFDERAPLSSPLDLSADSATTALAALGSGMITFTGFVMSVVLLVVQFGSSQFSPRFLRWFRSDPVVKHSLGSFIATFVFALTGATLSGRGPGSVVPYRGLIGAAVLTSASIAWFLALIARTSDNLRVAHVAQRVDAQARRVFDAVYPLDRGEASAAQEALSDLEPGAAVQEVRHRGVGTMLVAVDRPELLRQAERHDVLIEVHYAVGDHVPADGVLVRIYGDWPVPSRPIRGTLTTGDERTIEDDPAFTLRLLADVAIKALSPAVNDPTTAVQTLDRIEDVLRYAAGKHLSTGVVLGRGGRVRVLVPTPDWDDLVALALDEVTVFGAGQVQVVRRVRALLDDLITELPARRRPALERQAILLEEAAEASLLPGQQAIAAITDRQGLGRSACPVRTRPRRPPVLSDVVSIMPYAVAAAAAAPIVAVVTAVILAEGKQPVLGGWVFTLGAGLLDLAVAVVILVAFWGSNPSGSGSDIGAYIDTALGVLFLALGVSAVISKDTSDKDAARRRRVESAGAASLKGVFLLGIGAQIVNIDAMSVFTAGLKEVFADKATVGQAVVMVAAALAVMLIPYYGPILVYLARPESAGRILRSMTEWLLVRSKPLEVSVGLGFGAVFLAKGIMAL